jgi:hypothetical protein
MNRVSIGIALWLLIAPLTLMAEGPALDLFVVLDNSRSMQKSDPSARIGAEIADLATRLGTNARMGLIFFDETVRLALPLTPAQGDGLAALQRALGTLDYRGRQADSPGAVAQALYEFKTSGRPESGKAILFLTDGPVEIGNPAKSEERARWLREGLALEAQGKQIRIIAIGLADGVDFQLLQTLAQRTGGDYFRVSNPAALQATLERARTTLLASLPPPSPAPRPVEVDAPLPGLIGVPAPPNEPHRVPPFSTPPASQRPAPPVVAGASHPPLAPGSDLASAQEEASPLKKAVPGEGAGFWIGIAIAVGVVVGIGIGIGVFFGVRRHGARSTSTPTASTAMEPGAFLRDLSGKTNLPTHALGVRSVMLGRLAGSVEDGIHYIVVKDGMVGRRHALIEYRDFSYWLCDQGSVNGTMVNGRRVSMPLKLRHGDRILLHECEFEFVQPHADDDSRSLTNRLAAEEGRVGAGHALAAAPKPALATAQVSAQSAISAAFHASSPPPAEDAGAAHGAVVLPRPEGVIASLLRSSKQPQDPGHFKHDVGFARLPEGVAGGTHPGGDDVFDQPTLILGSRKDEAAELPPATPVGEEPWPTVLNGDLGDAWGEEDILRQRLAAQAHIVDVDFSVAADCFEERVKEIGVSMSFDGGASAAHPHQPTASAAEAETPDHPHGEGEPAGPAGPAGGPADGKLPM